MAKLSDAELSRVVQAAFLTADKGEIDTAVAIALAESGGDPNAHNSNKNGSEDFGLFQINSVHDGSLWDKGTLDRATGKVKAGGKEKSLYDPAFNAACAAVLYAKRGNKFTDWSAYKNGSYKKFLNRSTYNFDQALDDNDKNAKANVTGIESVSDAISSGIGAINSTIGKFFNSAGLWVLAAVLLVVGIVLIGRNQITSVAGKSPVGKALKTAKALKG